jgi:hypothetical protein
MAVDIYIYDVKAHILENFIWNYFIILIKNNTSQIISFCTTDLFSHILKSVFATIHHFLQVCQFDQKIIVIVSIQ